MAVHGTPRSTSSVHEFGLSPPMALCICGSLARRMHHTFVAGLCRCSSRGSLLLHRTVFHICSFAAVHSRQPPWFPCCSSATDRCHCLLTCFHRSAPPLVSCRCPPPHSTQVACPPTRIQICRSSITTSDIRSSAATQSCHHHCPLRCCIVAPPLLLDSC
jgi:hypothetical protein